MSTPARSRVSGAAEDTRSSSSRRNARRNRTTSAARRRLPSIFRVGCCPCSSWIGTRGWSRSSSRASARPSDGCTLKRTRLRFGVAAGRSRVHQPRADGGPVGAASGAPFRVKAHGSELRDPTRGRPELGEWARETLARADATYVGSKHIREVLADVVGHTDRAFDVPPGVDIDRFVLQDCGAALEDLLAEARKDPPNGGDERLPTTAMRSAWPRFSTGWGRSSFTSGS